MDNIDKQIAVLQERKALDTAREQAKQSLGFVVQDVNFPHWNCDKDNKPKSVMNCKANTAHMLDSYDIDVKYNRMTKQEEQYIPELKFNADIENNFKFNHIIDLAAHHQYPNTKLAEHLFNIADPYHPVCDFIESKKWDGVDRFEEFLKTVILTDDKDEDLKRLYFKRWFMSTIAALYEEHGVAAQGVLTYTGAQGIGKTSHMLTILPDADWLCEGTVLDPSDKDSVIEVTGSWLCELGEIDATFKKQDIARLKAFITKKKDTIRKPYERKSESHPRRTIFYASVNDKNFLVDKSGNRRFWVLDVKGFVFDHNIDIQQLWAQLKTMYDNGESWVMTKSELDLLNEKNEDFTQIDPIEEEILRLFRVPKDDESGIHMSATQICKGIDMIPSKPNTNNVARTMRSIGYNSKTKNNSKGFLVVEMSSIDNLKGSL